MERENRFMAAKKKAKKKKKHESKSKKQTRGRGKRPLSFCSGQSANHHCHSEQSEESAVPLLIVSSFLALSWRVHPLLRRRTQIPVGTEAAIEARLGLKVSRGDVLGYIFYFQFRFPQLQFTSGRDHRCVFLKVIENETFGAVFPLLARCQSVNRKLQALIGVFLRLRFAGFVIRDGDSAIAYAINAVNAPDDRCLAKSNLEKFLRVRHVREWSLARGCNEFPQLRHPLFFIKLMLVAILDTRVG